MCTVQSPHAMAPPPPPPHPPPTMPSFPLSSRAGVPCTATDKWLYGKLSFRNREKASRDGAGRGPGAGSGRRGRRGGTETGSACCLRAGLSLLLALLACGPGAGQVRASFLGLE